MIHFEDIYLVVVSKEQSLAKSSSRRADRRRGYGEKKGAGEERGIIGTRTNQDNEVTKNLRVLGRASIQFCSVFSAEWSLAALV